MKAARFFYDSLGTKLFGPYGFYDAFSMQEDWFPERYLTAAGGTLGGEGGTVTATITVDDSDDPGGGFRYVKEILQGHHAMLEFETTVEGKYANGVDIITCDDDGLITEFKVMMRPLQAINAVHAQMKAMLERLSE